MQQKEQLKQLLPCSNKFIHSTELWSDHYKESVLKETKLKKVQEQMQQSHRQQVHQRVVNFFNKKLKPVQQQQQQYQLESSRLYGVSQIIDECERESREIRQLSLRISRSTSRDKSPVVQWKQNREQRKLVELRAILKQKVMKSKEIR